jgi:ribose transport system substrate-binding protein
MGFGTKVVVARRVVTPLVVAMLGIGAVGCGSASHGSAGAGPSQAPAQMQADVAKWLSHTGTYQPPPKNSPKPQPGKTIALISCTITCQRPIAGAQAAAKILGWKTTVFNAGSDPTAAATGIRDAIAQKVDGIFVYYDDCKYIRSALEAAKAAGIPVVAAISLDCNPPLFRWVVTYVPGNFIQFSVAWGEAGASYAIVHLHGDAHLMVVTDNVAKSSLAVAAGAQQAIAKCGGCKFYPVYFPAADFTTGIRGLVSQALLSHPDVNAVMVGYEAVLGLGAKQAVFSSGRKPVFGVGEGGDLSLEALRSYNGVAFGTGYDIGWEGWSAMDGLNRIFAGQKPVDSGIGIQLYAKEANGKTINVPKSGRYVPPYDYPKLYTEAWTAAK